MYFFGGWFYTWRTSRSKDNGSTFHNIYSISNVLTLEIDNDNNILIGTDGSGVLKSTNNGDSWIKINNGLLNLVINDLIFSPENVLLAGTNNGLYRYIEELNFWYLLDTTGLLSKKINKLYYHNNILYAGTDLGLAYFTGEVPVELTSFTGFLSNRIVIMNWSTASEINNLGFEIQRSFKENTWMTIGFIQGKGTVSSQNNYSFSDDISEINYSGKILYRLKQIDFNGSFSYSEVIEIDLPTNNFTLFQNYPNPFNPETKIKYSVPEKTRVTLTVYDILGRNIKVLINNEEKEPGNYEVEFDGSSLATGVYFYRIEAGNFIDIKKFNLLK